MECYAGTGRLDLIMQRGTDRHGAIDIQEYKRIKLLKTDKDQGYGDSQRVRLPKEVLVQLDTRNYRGADAGPCH